MATTREFEKGWHSIEQINGAQLADYVGHKYIEKVSDTIAQLENNINEYAGSGKGIPQLGGEIAEEWVAGTFNIRAVAAESLHRATVEKSLEHASVDVSTNYGKDYSLKYLKLADLSVKAQAKNVIQNYHEYLSQAKASGTRNPMSFEDYLLRYGYTDDLEDLLFSVYRGQGRIIPSDQLEEGMKKLRLLIATESSRGGETRLLNMKNYEETLSLLSDRIKDGSGVESIPLTKEESHAIAELCKSGDFKPEDFGITLDSEISREYILNQALKGGITSAVVTLAIQLVPELLSLLTILIKEKDLSVDQIKRFGLKSVSAGAKGFIAGGLSCGIYTACKAGKLGGSFSNIEPGVVGTIVALTFNMIVETVDYAAGKTNLLDYKHKVCKDLIVSIASLAGGSIATSILPEANALSFMIGSILGSVIASIALSASERILVSLCVETGFTLFGLVKQDYELPKAVLEELGLNLVDIKKHELNVSLPNTIHLNRPSLFCYTPNIVEVKILKRGLISFHTVGFTS